jgi:hypothetical protein
MATSERVLSFWLPSHSTGSWWGIFCVLRRVGCMAGFHTPLLGATVCLLAPSYILIGQRQSGIELCWKKNAAATEGDKMYLREWRWHKFHNAG